MTARRTLFPFIGLLLCTPLLAGFGDTRDGKFAVPLAYRIPQTLPPGHVVIERRAISWNASQQPTSYAMRFKDLNGAPLGHGEWVTQESPIPGGWEVQETSVMAQPDGTTSHFYFIRKTA
jgi:hypothetical protein